MPTDQLPPPPPGPAPTDVPFSTVDSGRGIEWLKAAMAEIQSNPGIWLAIAAIYGVAAFVLALVPFIGALAVALLTPVIMGGLMMGARQRAQGGVMKIEHMWAGFQGGPTTQLFLLGALLLGAAIVIGLVVGAITAMMVAGAMRGGSGIGMSGLLIGGVIGLIAAIPVGMAIWFAPALVAVRGVDAITAVRSSFKASLANLVPLLVMGAIVFVAMLVVNVLLGVTIVLIPLASILNGMVLMLMCAAMYASFREVFGG